MHNVFVTDTQLQTEENKCKSVKNNCDINVSSKIRKKVNQIHERNLNDNTMAGQIPVRR